MSRVPVLNSGALRKSMQAMSRPGGPQSIGRAESVKHRRGSRDCDGPRHQIARSTLEVFTQFICPKMPWKWVLFVENCITLKTSPGTKESYTGEGKKGHRGPIWTTIMMIMMTMPERLKRSVCCSTLQKIFPFQALISEDHMISKQILGVEAGPWHPNLLASASEVRRSQ